MAYIDRKLFCDTLVKLREAHDLQEKVNELFRQSRENIECDFQNAAALQISHETAVIKILMVAMDDHFEDIEYFVYELDYGRKYKPGMVTDGDGKDIDLSTEDRLYDWLMYNIICREQEGTPTATRRESDGA